MLEQALTQLEQKFSLSKEAIINIASCFREHMEQGLDKRESSLKMFPSYLQAPDGQEAGVFLALDLGGSNVRVSVVELKGKGRFQELHKLTQPLSAPESGCDFRAEAVTAEELFGFLAGIIQEVLTNLTSNPPANLSSPEIMPLGFAFSFPYRQRKIDEGVLLRWNKEVKTSGVIGKDVGSLLSAALRGLGLDSVVKLTAIINDTTATFLASAYQDPGIDIASIIGTGHNTCYLEQHAPGFAVPVIINTESGNFSAAPATLYDHKLDLESDNPGEQKFEKKLSGKYLGELFRQIVLDLAQQNVLDLPHLGLLTLNISPDRWNQPYSISGKDLSLILAEDASVAQSREYFVLKQIAHILANRSARLVAASLIGIMRHLDPHLDKRHTVAIDGSLYQGMPGYAQELTAALSEVLGSKSGLITVKLSAGGSLTGAAIAAALAKQRPDSSI